jgi:hypothetical protein
VVITDVQIQLLNQATHGHADKSSAYDQHARCLPGYIRVRGSARIMACRRLVLKKLMRSEGPPLSFTGGEIFSITNRGRAVAEQRAKRQLR